MLELGEELPLVDFLCISYFFLYICLSCKTGREKQQITAAPQFFPTRMLGLRRGSKFGSEPAEARPSLAMMIINVKNPKTPTKSIMKTRCFQDRVVFFPPVRFFKIRANQLSAGRRRYLSSSKSICVTEL